MGNMVISKRGGASSVEIIELNVDQFVNVNNLCGHSMFVESLIIG